MLSLGATHLLKTAPCGFNFGKVEVIRDARGVDRFNVEGFRLGQY